ncbi:hypothetical protein I4U23_017236 [Adineta vaga]|nr:hypothetical protein I4U23_017236 [Adineta vaga]
MFSVDQNYLNAQRWEQIIQRNLSQLEEFYMTYITNFHKTRQLSSYSNELNQFFSPFWLQREWILEIEIECVKITYFIHPYKKRWFENNEQKKVQHSIEELSKSMQFSLSIVSPEKWYSTLTIHDYIKQTQSAMKIDQLHIRSKIFVVKLIEILESLPKLDALKLSTVSFLDPRKMKIKLFLRLLLIQIRNRSRFQNFRLLCIRYPTVDDKMILKLKQMIQDENLLVDFTIKRLIDKVYVE